MKRTRTVNAWPRGSDKLYFKLLTGKIVSEKRNTTISEEQQAYEFWKKTYPKAKVKKLKDGKIEVSHYE